LFPAQYPSLNLVFLGDFNCPQSHTVFIPLRNLGYENVFRKQKTSLKKKCINLNCLASEFDNIWFKTSNFKVFKKRAVLFYEHFDSLNDAATVSDHIPLEVVLDFVK
jgi:endonuclease/exonuclease/phosphatase family metal-dependent hydrolase